MAVVETDELLRDRRQEKVRLPKQFFELESAKGWFYVVTNALVVTCSGTAAYYVDTWWCYVLAFVLVGARAQALYILQHECMHWILFPNRRTNNIMGVLLSGILGTRLYDGRAMHFQHHRDVGLPSDPNTYWHGTENHRPGWSTIKFFLLQLIGGRLLGVFLRTLHVLTGIDYEPAQSIDEQKERSENVPERIRLRRKRESQIDICAILVVQGILFASMSLVASPWVYVLLFFCPIVTLTCLFESFRSFSEHVLPGDQSRNVPEELRSFLMDASRVELFFISQFWFNYHHLHHLYPRVATFKLRKLHRWLQENDERYEDKYIRRPGYVSVALNYILNRPINGGGENYPLRRNSDDEIRQN